MMNVLGRHVLTEIYGCNVATLNNVQEVERLMVAAALAAGAEVINSVFHQFSPQGVSGVVVISESHLAIHTWPELGYAAVDVFTCSDNVNPWDICHCLANKFQAKQISAQEVKRGIHKDLLSLEAASL